MNTARQSLFAYRPGTSALHHTPAGIKFPVLLGITMAVFSGPWQSVAVSSVLVFLAALLARLETRGRGSALRLLCMWALFIAFFRIIGKPLNADALLGELQETGLYTWRLGVVMLAGAVFYETTSGLEIRDAFAKAEDLINALFSFVHRLSPLRRSISSPRLPQIAFLLSLTIVFIPRIFDAWSGLERAWTARGGASKGFRAGFQKISALLPLLVIRLLALASDTDRAIRNRSR